MQVKGLNRTMTLKHVTAVDMVSALPGYMVHLSETCDDDQCHLITNVMTTTADLVLFDHLVTTL